MGGTRKTPDELQQAYHAVFRSCSLSGLHYLLRKKRNKNKRGTHPQILWKSPKEKQQLNLGNHNKLQCENAKTGGKGDLAEVTSLITTSKVRKKNSSLVSILSSA